MMIKPIVIGALGTVIKGLVRELEDLEIRVKGSIVEIGQNTKKSPGDLRKPVVTQTTVKDH